MCSSVVEVSLVVQCEGKIKRLEMFPLDFVAVFIFLCSETTLQVPFLLLFNLERDEWTFSVFTSHRRTGRDVLNGVQLQRIKQQSLAKVPEVSSEETRTFPYTRARAQPSNIVSVSIYSLICF